MPENWKTYKLGDICELRKDSISPKNFNNEDYIGLEHIGQGTFLLEGLGNAKDVSSNKYKFSSGDILYGKIRPYFKKAYRPSFAGICSTDMLIFKTLNEDVVRQKFLYHLIKTQDFTDRATETSSGTKMPRADWKSLSQVKYEFPPLLEQKAIASILSTIDDKIENNLAMNKTLEDMAMTLYKHWFVDFGPFQEGNFFDSELGTIPEGWEATNMGEVTDLKQGLAINKKTNHLLCEKGEFSIPLFKIRDLIKDTVEHYVKRDEVPKQCIAQKDDLIFTRTGQVGYVFRWKEGCVHNNCFKVIPNNKLEKEYLYQFLLNPVIKQLTNDIASGSVQKDLNHTSFKSIEIVLPPIDIQNKYRDIVLPLVTKQNENVIENYTLTKLRDTLLPKLISGEVRLKEFEKKLTAAL